MLNENQFKELKDKAMALWVLVDPDNDAYGYVTEKHRYIKDIPNITDNFTIIIGMFDSKNKSILFSYLSEKTKQAIYNAD